MTTRSSDQIRHRVIKTIQLHTASDLITVSFDPAADVPLGLRIHQGEGDSFLRTAMRRWGGQVVSPARIVRFDRSQQEEAVALAEIMLDRLVKIARKPLSQKVVERLLAISSAERTRWTKEGRLRQSGTAEMARGGSRVTCRLTLRWQSSSLPPSLGPSRAGEVASGCNSGLPPLAHAV